MAIMTGQVEKFYIARVRGKFPMYGRPRLMLRTGTGSTFQLSRWAHSLIFPCSDRVECAEPLVQAETGVSLVDYEKGRTAHTIFEHAGYDSATDTRYLCHRPVGCM